MTTTSTSFQFKLSGVTGTPKLFSTRQNVKKYISRILYLESPGGDAAKLGYVGSDEITPAKNLFIGDRSDTLFVNSRTNTIQEFITDAITKYITVTNTNFIVTQQFVEAASGSIPLYFKDNLPNTTVPETVKVFDQDFNPVSEDKWKVVPEYIYDEDTGNSTGVVNQYLLFNSLENTFDSEDGSYTVYFVQFVNSVSGVDTTTTYILDNEYAYLPAEAQDFWYLTPGELKPWAYVYHIDNYVVQLPAIRETAARYLESQRVSVQQPTDSSDIEPWFPRVANGAFTYTYNNFLNTYEIPEFDNQAFNPIAPYKYVTRKLSQKIDDRLLKLPHGKIQTGITFSDVSIVFELNNVAQYAITTDSSLSGADYLDFDGKTVTNEDGELVKWSTVDLLGFDRLSGIVHVNFDILDSYEIYASYPYEEEFYTLTSLSMNPIFDRDIHKEVRVVYIVPENYANGNTSIQTASIMWLKVSKAGIINSTNQDSSGNNENIKTNVALGDVNGYYLTGVLGMHYSWQATTTASAQTGNLVPVIPGSPFYVSSTEDFPNSGWLRAKDASGNYRYFKYESKEDTYFMLSDSSSETPAVGSVNIPNSNQVTLVNFIEERSTVSTRNPDDEINSWGPGVITTTYPSVYSQYFILADLSVNSQYDKSQLSLIDIREDGGGIDPDSYEDAKRDNPEVQWTNPDMSFDGQIYPSNAVIVIKVPHSILDEFSLDNIKQIASEKVPYGVYPLIRFYGYEPRIISILPGTAYGSVVAKWQKEGPEFTYDIWYAKHVNGPWIKANTTLITDGSGTYNTFTISDLTDPSLYYIRITMQDRYYSWWYSYNSYDSIEGGLGLDEATPVPPFGNVASFQFEIL
jgi:hypothetical protein